MKILLCFGLCLISSGLFSQDKNAFYAMDAGMNQTTLEKSKYILWIHEKEDSNWQWDYYFTWGPLVKSQSFADHDGTILNGRSCQYNTLGNLDSTGVFDHGKRNGRFYKYKTYSKDSFAVIAQYDYKEDSLTKKVDFLKENKPETIDTLRGHEAEFPGGLSEWYKFMALNLRYPDRAAEKGIQGETKITFTVDSTGDVKDVFIQKSVEYSLDQEALRIINISGTWNPATFDGEKVRSNKVQPINFKLEDK